MPPARLPAVAPRHGARTPAGLLASGHALAAKAVAALAGLVAGLALGALDPFSARVDQTTVAAVGRRVVVVDDARGRVAAVLAPATPLPLRDADRPWEARR